MAAVKVENMSGTSTTPFWPGGGKALNVEFGADSGGMCNVCGTDPENDNQVVFNGVLWTQLQDLFIEAVRTGKQGTPVSNENAYLVSVAPVAPSRVALRDAAPVGEPPDGCAVVVPVGDPRPPIVVILVGDLQPNAVVVPVSDPRPL